jgi:tripartite-type tricarboxylate transporter receptor subunit TctC
MEIQRRQLLHLAAGAVALPAVSRVARAQAYPTRPVRIVVAFPPGGGPDIGARRIAQWLSERIGQQFFVDNRPGAAGNLGTEAVVRAPPDGYTLLAVGANDYISSTLYQNLKFNFLHDIRPVASEERMPNAMVVPPSSPANTVTEFIDFAKNNLGKVNMASSGVGASPHLSGELFQMMTGVKFLHVPYRGMAAGGYADLMAGTVHVAFDNLPGSIELIRAGRLKALGVTSALRSEALPNVPSISEFVSGYEASPLTGFGVPKDTPPEIIDKLNIEINAGLTDPTLRARIAQAGGLVIKGSPADFGKLIADETDKWAKVIRAANIKPE